MRRRFEGLPGPGGRAGPGAAAGKGGGWGSGMRGLLLTAGLAGAVFVLGHAAHDFGPAAHRWDPKDLRQHRPGTTHTLAERVER